MKKIISFFAEVKQELEFVNWLPRKVTFQLMSLVSLFVFLFGVFFLGLDYLIISLVNLLNYF